MQGPHALGIPRHPRPLCFPGEHYASPFHSLQGLLYFSVEITYCNTVFRKH